MNTTATTATTNSNIIVGDNHININSLGYIGPKDRYKTEILEEAYNDLANKQKQSKFGGAVAGIDKQGNLITIYITKVIYQKPATIVFWSDGTKTIAKCSPYDTYNTEMGLLVCYAKRIMGSEAINKLLDDWHSLIHYDTITLADVRHRNKE